MTAALVTRKEAAVLLFGKDAGMSQTTVYRAVQNLVNEGTLTVYAKRYFSRAEINRLRGDSYE